jgi:hypothetical protein
MKCPKCGYQNPDSAIECSDCGVIFSRIAVSGGAGNGETEKRGNGEFAQPYGTISQITEKTDEATPMEIAGVLLLGDKTEVNPLYFWGRAAAFVLILLYSWKFISYPLEPNMGHSFLHNVDLAFHEAGHLIFMPFGRFMSVLGGSLFQALVPLFLAGAFLLYYRNPVGAAMTTWWAGQSLVDIAPYIYDARNRQLILLGGKTGRDDSTMHDWYNILSQLDLLRFDHAIAKAAKGMGVLIMLTALVWGGTVLYRQWGKI